jgi:broad specificity phosphatase PhoE
MELSIRIPYIFWLLAGRVAWFCSHQSQTETIKQTEERVNRFVLSILEEENVLIVTHGFLMVQIQEQLINNGFSGNCFKRAKCGKIYISEKENDGKS